MNKTLRAATFVGGGIDASSIFPTTQSGMPYQAFAAPWPLARLMVHKDAVVFHMGYIHKGVSRSDVTVTLSKSGYIFFRASNKANGFGFGPTKVAEVIGLLKSYGYHLDASCTRNLGIAQFSQRVWAVILPIAYILVGVNFYIGGAIWLFVGFVLVMSLLIAFGTFSSKNGDPHSYLAYRGKPRPEDPDDWSNLM